MFLSTMATDQPQPQWRGPDHGPQPPHDGPPPSSGSRPTEPAKLPWPGNVGLWLLWLSIALPASALVFIGLPCFGAILALFILENAGVSPGSLGGPWASPILWPALGLTSVGVHAYATVHHRRPKRELRSGRRLWFLLGTAIHLAAFVVAGLESAPGTDLAPVVHYATISAALAWWVLTLAYLTGRLASVFVAPVERWAIRSQGVRGALAATGPMSLVVVVSVVGSNVAHEIVEGELGGSRGSLTSGLADTSLGRQLSDGAHSGASGSSEGFDECLEAIYGTPPPTLFEAVAESTGPNYSNVDGERTAAETALAVCFQGGWTGEILERRYRDAARKRANDLGLRGNLSKFDDCESWGPGIPSAPPELADCLGQQLCQLPRGQQTPLRLFLRGQPMDEIAERLNVGESTAHRRVGRARDELWRLAEQHCSN